MSSNPLFTPAMARLAREQRSRPIRGRPDRASQLAALIEPHLPDSLRALLANGVVAVGEIARDKPDVRTIPVEGANFVVLFNSGIMDFVYAVYRAMSRITTFLGDQEKPGAAASEADGVALVAEEITRLFTEWRRHNRFFSRKNPIKHATFAVSVEALELTELLAKLSEMFILAHELGHVDLDRNDAPCLGSNVELNADALGFVSYFPAATQHINPRLAFAAAVLAVRIFAGLERVGVEFSTHYPPQRVRMGLLHELLAGLCPCRQHYHELTTISVGYESLMDHVDDLIEGRKQPGTSYPDAGRLLGFLIGALEELGKVRCRSRTSSTLWNGGSVRCRPTSCARQPAASAPTTSPIPTPRIPTFQSPFAARWAAPSSKWSISSRTSCEASSLCSDAECAPLRPCA